jgi:histidinol-phosphate aminotransferase
VNRKSVEEVNIMQPKQQIVHLPVYQPGKPIEEVKRELGLDEVIKLASNENPFGCSPKAKEAIQNELANVNIYPDGAAVELTRVLAESLNVKPEQIIFGAGSDEIIMMLARAFLSPEDNSVMASHTFSQYKHNVMVEGAEPITVPLKDGTHDLDAMLACVNSRTKIVWICNPNNPTGTLVSLEKIRAFMEKVPDHVLVVLDEAYYEYIAPEDYGNSLDLLKAYKNVIILRTFSKIHGLAALRVGYGIGHPDVLRSINQVREPFNTSRLGQAAAMASVKDPQFIEECRRKNAEGLQYLNEQFTRLGLKAFPSYTNFIMVDVKKPAGAVFDALLRKGIIVRGGHQLGFPTSLRVTVGTRDQNEKFIRALEQVLNEVPVEA